MSRSVDERIVEMRFDNRNFEKNASQSMSTLDKLKEKLNFKGTSKAMDELNHSMKGFDASPVSKALDTVSDKFSVLEQVAIGALRRIGDRIAQTGEQLIKSLTVDNIGAGWAKYGDKTTSVATLVAQGYAMEEVNDQLERLNWYTDETSYNFVEMVGSIGKFTASGQKLDDAVTAMQGIANWAARSGQNAATASRAMYQLSQAMSKGALKYDDWRSIQNANMDTIEFRRQAAEAAVALGSLEKAGEDAYKVVYEGANGVREVSSDIVSLNDLFTSDFLTRKEWLDTDVMMTVFSNYGKATKTLKAIVDDETNGIDTASEAMQELRNQAQKLVDEANAAGKELTFDDALKQASLNMVEDLSDVKSEAYDYIKSIEESEGRTLSFNDALIELGYSVDKFSLDALEAAQEARTWTDVIDSVKDAVSTGWMNTFENIFGNYKEAKKLWTDLANELYDVFAEGGNERNEVLKEWASLGGRDLLFANTDDETGAFWNLFYALTDVINAIKEAFRDIFPPATADKLLDLTNKFKTFTENIRLNSDQLSELKHTFTGVFSVFSIIGKTITAVVNGFKPLLSIFDVLKENSTGLITDFLEWAILFNKSSEGLAFFESVTKKTTAIVQKFVDIISGGLRTIHEFSEAVSSIFESKDKQKNDRFSKITEFFSKIFEKLSGITKIFSKIKEVLSPIFKAIGDSIGSIFESIKESFDGSFDSINLDSITKIIETIAQGGLVISLGKLAKQLTEFTSKFNLKKMLGFGDIFESIGDALEKFSGVLKAQKLNINIDSMTKLGKAMLMLAASLLIVSLIDADKLKSAISSITTLFTDLIVSFVIIGKTSNGLKGLNLVAVGMALEELAIALLILSVSMKNISELSWEDMGKSLAAMAIALQLLPAALNSTKPEGAFKKALSMILLTTSLVILSVSMKKISELSWEDIGKSLVAMAISLQLLPAALNSTKPEGAFKKALSMILLTTSLIILSVSMKKISELSWEDIGKSLAAMAIALQLLPEALNSTKPEGAFKKALSMILLTTSLIILTVSMKKISELSWEDIGKSVAAMAITLQLLPAALNSTKPEGAFKKALSMILLTTSLIILSVSMKKISELSWEDIGKSLASMAIALFVISETINNVGEPNLDKATALSIAASSLIAIAKYMTMISDLSWEDIGKSLAAMVITLFMLTESMNRINEKGIIKKSLSLLVVGSALLTMALSLKLLSTIGWAGLIVGLVGLVSVLTVLGLASKLLAPLTGDIVKLSASIAVFSASMALFGISTMAIGAGLIAIGIGLTTIGTSMPIIASGLKSLIPVLIETLPVLISGIALAIVKAAPDIAEAIKTTISSILSIIRDSLPEIVSTLLETITTILVNLSDSLPLIVSTIFSLIDSILTSLIDNLPSIGTKLFTVVIGFLDILIEYTPQLVDRVISIILGVINGLSVRIPDIVNTILDFIKSVFGGLLSLIGGLIGTLVGEIANSIGTAIADGLPHIGEKLSEFSNTISPFMNSMSGLSEDSMRGVKLLAETILLITASELLSSLSDFVSFFGGSTKSSFGDTIVSFGGSIAEFAELTKDIDGNKVESSANAAKALAGFANAIPKEGGLWQQFFGTGDLTKFGEELASFAPHFVKYANTVSDIKDTSAVVASAQAAESLAKFANNLPKHDGIWQEWVGDSSLTSFAAELESFAPALVSYSETVKGIDSDSVQNSVTAATSISKFAENLPKHDGIWQAWVGDASLTTFAEELKSFAPALVEYSKTVVGLDTKAIEASTSAATMLSTLEENLPDTGGVVSWFAGDNTLTGFSEGLPVLGTALHDYVYNLGSDFDTDKADAATAAASALGALQSGLSDTGGLVSLFAGDNTLKGFSEGLPVLGTALHDYVYNLGSFDPSVVSLSTEALQSLSDLETGLSNSGGLEALVNGDNTLALFGEGVQVLGSGLNSFYNDIKDIEVEEIKKVISFLADAIEENKPKIKNKFDEIASIGVECWKNSYSSYQMAGSMIMGNLITGMKEATLGIKSAIGDMTKSLMSNVKKEYESFKELGRHFVYGFVEGLNGGHYDVSKAARSLALEAERAIKDELQIHSPSKVMYGLGEYAGQGFVNALGEYASISSDAGNEVGSSAIDGIRNAILNSSYKFDTSIDAEPTITPVVDLSNVRASAAEINGIMSSNANLTARMAETASFSFKNPNIDDNVDSVQKIDDRNIVDEISKLQNNITDLVDKVSKLQVVMDSGALVGELISPIDQELGIRAVRSRRERG